MTFLNYIWLALIVCIALYVLVAGVAFCYELRLRRLYAMKQQLLAKIEILNISNAVRYAKQFKIEADYRLAVERIENKKLFIMKKLLHLSRRRCGCEG